MVAPKLRLAAAADGPPPSPERARLAECVAKVAAVQAALARIETAREKTGARWEAMAGAETAEEALRAAKGREAERLVHEAMEGSAWPQQTVPEAEAGLAAARDEVTRRRRFHDALDAEEAEAKQRLFYAKTGRRDALRDVLAADPAVIALLQEYEAARQRVANLGRMLAEVSDGLPQYWDIRSAPLPESGVELPWRAAVEALAIDATAALPKVI